MKTVCSPALQWSFPWQRLIGMLWRVKATFVGAFVIFALGTIPAWTADMTVPRAGTPLRREILDDLRAAGLIVSIAKEQKKKVIFEKVTLRTSGEWAWSSVAPRTEDGQWQTEHR